MGEPLKYRVMVDDNFHYMDESYRYLLGEYEDCGAAKHACVTLVDVWLSDQYKPGMTAQQLFEQYTSFGEDPWIKSDDPGCKFSAWTYAEARAKEIASKANTQ